MKTLITSKEEKVNADELYEAIKELPKEHQRDVEVMIMTIKMLLKETPREPNKVTPDKTETAV